MKCKKHGNLAFEYNYKVNMKDVDIQNNIEISNEISNQEIFYSKILKKEETQEFAKSIFEKINASINENETIFYEDTAIYYSENRKYSMWIEYKGGTYTYTDFSIYDSKEDINIKEKTGASREEIENGLQKLGIEIPKGAEFKEKENNQYIFEVNMERSENALIDGSLNCSYYEDGIVRRISNNIIKYEKVREKEVISKQEAYNKILQGKFQYDEYYLGDIKKLVVEDITLGYALDSKGYYVPIYVFDVKINDRNTQIQIKALK